MELPLTFQVPVIMAALNKVQRGYRARILHKSDVKQFLGACLRLGFLIKRYPSIIEDGYYVKASGGYVDKPNTRTSTSICLINTFMEKKTISVCRETACKVNPDIGHGYGKVHSGEIYSTPCVEDFYRLFPQRRLLNSIQLKHVTIPEGALDIDQMPLYINIPVLSIYAKERLAGLVTKGALC
jgi:hypothetical protein